MLPIIVNPNPIYSKTIKTLVKILDPKKNNKNSPIKSDVPINIQPKMIKIAANLSNLDKSLIFDFLSSLSSSERSNFLSIK